MTGSVNLFDFDFRVDVAVVEKIDVDFLHFGNAVLVRDHGHDVVQRQQTVTLDFSVDVLAHGAKGQQSDQFNVIPFIENKTKQNK